MTQATNIIIPVQADSVGIPPHRIVMGNVTGGFNGFSTASGGAGGFLVGFIGVSGELGIDPNTVGDVTALGVGYVKIGQVGLINGTPIASDAIGQGIAATAAGQKIVGFLLEVPTTIGQICKILVSPGVY